MSSSKGNDLGREALDRGELDLPSTESDRALIRSNLGLHRGGRVCSRGNRGGSVEERR
jgi:hypothetical protein